MAFGPTLVAKLALDKSNFDKNLKNSKSTILAIGKAVAGAAFAGSIAMGVTDSIKMFAEFENKMKTVQTLLDGDAKNAVEGFSNEIIDMTTRIPVKANDLADSLFDVISAGVDAGDSIAFLEEAAKLAVSGATDTKTAVDGMTSAYNAFSKEGLSANEIADKFFAAQKRGKTTIAELSTTIGRVSPTAAAMNMSLDDTLGIIASLTTKGISTAESVTGLKAVISNIIKPSKEAADEAARLGLKFDESALKSNGLVGILQTLKDRVDKGDTSFTKMFGSVEALNTVLALADDNFISAKDSVDAVATSTGLSTEKFNEQKESLQSNFILIANNIDALKLKLGSTLAPVILYLSEQLLNLFDPKAYEGLSRVFEITGIQIQTMLGEVGLFLTESGNKLADWADYTAIKNEEVTQFFKNSWLALKGFFTDTENEKIQLQIDSDKKIKEIEARALERDRAVLVERSKLYLDQKNKIIELEKKYTIDQETEVDKRTTNIKNAENSITASTRGNLDYRLQNYQIKYGNITNTVKNKLTGTNGISEGEIDLTNATIGELNARKDNAETIYTNLADSVVGSLTGETGSIRNAELSLTKDVEKEAIKRKAAYDELLEKISDIGSAMATDPSRGVEMTVDLVLGNESDFMSNARNIFSGILGDEAGSFVSGLFGTVITRGITDIITGIFGSKPVKTVAEMAEDSFDRMVKNTNRALNDIGREKTSTELAIDVLEEMAAQGETFVGAEVAPLIDMAATTRIEDAITSLLDVLSGLESSELQTVTDEIARQQAEIDRLRTVGEQMMEASRQAVEEFGLNESDILRTNPYRNAIEAAQTALDRYIQENADQPLQTMLDLLNLRARASEVGMATGGSFVLNEPTRIAPGIIAGEAGPEQVTVTPLGQGGQMKGNITINVNGAGQSPDTIANRIKYVLDDPFYASSYGERISI